MIIVKTKNGSVLINDRETHLVEHLKDKSMVVVRSDQHKVNANIMDVESVIYVNDAHATEWKDEGSEIERLKAELENEKRENHIMCEHFGFIREWFFIYQNTFYDIKNAVLRSKNGSKCEDLVIDALIDAAEKKYQESQEIFKKVRAKWEE